MKVNKFLIWKHWLHWSTMIHATHSGGTDKNNTGSDREYRYIIPEQLKFKNNFTKYEWQVCVFRISEGC